MWLMWLSGCLLGVVVEVVPPTLEGGPRVLSPAAAEDGTVFVREGSELTLRLALNRPIDLDASSLTLEGAALDCAPTEGDEATLLCRRTFDGEEGSGPKGLTGELVDASGRRSAVATPALVQADFIPPTAGCVLSPRSARAADRIRLAVVPSEPLEAPPVVTATVPGVGVGDGTLKDGQYLYDVTGPAGVDVPAYTLVVPAVDRAGNPADGGSLCAVVDRTGSYLGLGPVSDGEIQVTADPSIDLDGVPWVRAGAVVTVRIPTVEPVDPEASRVTLSGLDLLPVPGVPGTWSRTVTGLDGDGLKDLEAQLVDDARNPLGVRVEDVIGFDLTPPSGACFVSPSPANGVEPVTFSFTPEEPLREPPTFVSGQVVIAPPERSGARWRSAVQAPPEANTTFLVEVTATDRVGNEASGAQVCAEADRTGQVLGIGPTASAVVLSVEGERTYEEAGQPPLVALGARVVVDIATPSDLDLVETTVQVGDIRLDPMGGGRWEHVVVQEDIEGAKPLRVRLVDRAGNRTEVDAGGASVTVDLSAPSADCTLSPLVARVGETSIFVVRAHEPLGAVDVRSNDPRAKVRALPPISATLRPYEVAPEGAVNVDFVLAVDAVDRVGNAAIGLCDPADRSGGLRNIVPDLLDAPAIAVAPSTFVDGGVPWAKAGDTVTVRLVTTPGLDEDATRVTLAGRALGREPDGSWSLHLDGTEGDGGRELRVRLADPAGNTTERVFPGAVRLDFTAPSASCVVGPLPVAGGEVVTASLAASEPLDAAPRVEAAGLSALGPTTYEVDRWVRRFRAPDGVDARVSLEVSATDRVGNTATGDALCPEDDRVIEVKGVAPALVGGVTLEVVAGPSAVDGAGDTRVGGGAVLAVAFDTEAPIDRDLSSVLLGDLPMPWDAASGTWRATVAPQDADGPKRVRLTLVDRVGNRTVASPDLGVVVDQTPPAATCLLAPSVANADAPITLDLFFAEDLAPDGFSVSAPAPLTVVPPPESARTLAVRVVQPDPRVDIDTYTVTVSATDLVGNTAAGDSLCPAAARSGRIKGVGPRPAGEVTLSVVPSVEEAGVPRARHGALVRVETPTLEDIDPVASRVWLGGLLLGSVDGQAWTGVLDRTLADGPKELSVSLVDWFGNPQPVATTLSVTADFSPPGIANVVLARAPFLQGAGDGSSRVSFSTHDPLTGEPVEATLRVVTTEDLGPPPVLSVTGPAALAWGPPVVQTSRVVAWTLPSLPAGPDGDHGFAVVLEDALGNVSEPLPLDVVLALDTQGPTQRPDVDVPDRIVDHRAPWGTSSGDTSSPSFEVRGAQGAAAPGTLVTIETPWGARLASGFADEDGAFEVAYGSDAGDVVVRTHDVAGNPSPAARVRDVAWTATLAGKVAGASGSNPHALHRVVAEGPDDPPWRPALIAQGVEVADAGFSYAVPSPPWTPWSPRRGASPGPAHSFATAYDAARGVVVVHGGTLADGSISDETWEWDGQQWTPRVQRDGPGARTDHAMAYDALRGVVVLYGGWDGGSSPQDTWEWDGRGWTLRASGGVAQPGSRTRHRMAFDAARGEVLMFGGLLSDASTWAWDGEAWRRALPPAAPPSRWEHAMAYDPGRGVVVLHGGIRSGNQPSGDTWVWDGATWTEVGPVSGPPVLAGHAMVYDEAAGALLLVGGFDGTTRVSTSWTWSGTGWSPRATPGAPPPRDDHGLAYDVARQRVVLVGGSVEGAGASDDTWTWDGSTWSVVRMPGTPSSPSARSGHAMVFDPDHEETVLFGGESSGAPVSDHWAWDGDLWTRRLVSTPSSRTEHAMAFDEGRGVLVLFGGRDGTGALGDTWEWDGASWTRRSPATSPPARAGHAMAFDPVRGEVVLYGGEDGVLRGVPITSWDATSWFSDTWGWNGTTWTNRTTNNPGARSRHAMVHDRVDGVVLLSGGALGASARGDTWAWSGSGWLLRSTAPTPPLGPLAGHGMVFDETLGAPVAYGGSVTNDRAIWDGATWTRLPMGEGMPTLRSEAGVAFDGVGSSLVVFGGATAGGVRLGDTWTSRMDSTAFPRLQLSVSTQALDLDPATIRDVTAWWVGGGVGTPGGTRQAGASLAVWDGRGWTELDAHTADVASPAALCARIVADPEAPAVPDCAELVDGDLAHDLFRFGEARTSTFALVPTGPIGTGEGRVRSVDVAVTVRFRRAAE